MRCMYVYIYICVCVCVYVSYFFLLFLNGLDWIGVVGWLTTYKRFCMWFSLSLFLYIYIYINIF